MEVAFVIKRRLAEFGLEQRELAHAADVTDSYISQLLTGKKKPPAPNRTDIYEKMERLLKLPGGELAALAEHERKERLKRALGEEAKPLLADVRDLILRKCDPRSRDEVRAVFERHPFGELERLVAKTLVDLVKSVAQSELENELWLRTVAELGGHGYREMRVIVLDFLDADTIDLSREHCVSFLDPLIASWNIDLASFAIDVHLTERVGSAGPSRFEFVRVEPPRDPEAGLEAFLRDPTLSGTVTAEELAHLQNLEFRERRPTALYYYRALQSLRDPLHFEQVDDAP
jgi:transcriptional regulator with XRE-family HTH domain